MPLLSALLVLLLTGCLPAGVELNTPLGGFETSHPPAVMKSADNDICMQTTGSVTLTKGAVINCGPSDAPAPDQTPETLPPVEAPALVPAPVEPAPAPLATTPPAAETGPDGASEEASGVPDPLAEHVRTAQDGENVAYCDVSGLHIGDGHKIVLTDEEREALICADLQQARKEAKRVLGAFTWAGLDEVRQDAWILLCYNASCAGFTDAAHLTRVGAYASAALEVLDSTCATCLNTVNPEGAARIARWFRNGVRD